MIGANDVFYVAQHVVLDCLKLYEGQPHQSRSGVASIRTVETQRNNVTFPREERNTVVAHVERAIIAQAPDQGVVPEAAVERVVAVAAGQRVIA